MKTNSVNPEKRGAPSFLFIPGRQLPWIVLLFHPFRLGHFESVFLPLRNASQNTNGMLLFSSVYRIAYYACREQHGNLLSLNEHDTLVQNEADALPVSFFIQQTTARKMHARRVTIPSHSFTFDELSIELSGNQEKVIGTRGKTKQKNTFEHNLYS